MWQQENSKSPLDVRAIALEESQGELLEVVDHKQHVEPGLLSSALKYHDTVMPETICHPQFWVFVVMHIIFKILFMLGFIDGVADHEFGMDWKDIKCMTGMTVFLLVFYTNQNYGNYKQLYGKTKALLASIPDLTIFLRFTIQAQEPAYARLAFRYHCAAILLFLKQMTHLDDPISQETWYRLIASGLMRDEEVRIIVALPQQQRMTRLLQWETDVVKCACDKIMKEGQRVGCNKVFPTQQKDCRLRCQHVRRLAQDISDDLHMPVPFPYFHITNMMVLVVQICWCYKMALDESLLQMFVFVLALFVFLGMLTLSSQLANPFGDDDVDFPVEHWVDEYIKGSLFAVEDREELSWSFTGSLGAMFGMQ